jgi:hypothetical protein
VLTLRIIDQDIWEQAQVLKSRYASHAGNKRQTKKRLLTGLVRCGCCGGNMTIARKDRYYCAARREKGTCKAAFGIAAAEVENRVLGGLREILVGNEGLVEEFTTELKAELARLKKRTTSDQGAIRNDLAEVERGIGRCVDFIMSGDGTSGSVRERLTKLEDQKSILQAQLARSAVTPIVSFHPNYADFLPQESWRTQRWSRDFGPLVKVDQLVKEMIQNDETKEPLVPLPGSRYAVSMRGGFQSQGCA